MVVNHDNLKKFMLIVMIVIKDLVRMQAIIYIYYCIEQRQERFIISKKIPFGYRQVVLFTLF